jgi:beta-phosphoglucomutase
MKISACIFDLDGVIVDTAKYHYIAWRELANRLGFDFTEAQNERLKGVSRMRSLEIILEIGDISLTEQEKEDFATEKNELYRSYIMKMDETEILPGVLNFLDELDDAGIPFALGSASKNAPTILERVGLMHRFKAIVDGNSVTKAKPDPEVFLLGAKQLCVKAEECVVFEDAAAGVEAAHNAGMKAIGVGDSEILGHADAVIASFAGFGINRMVGALSR